MRRRIKLTKRLGYRTWIWNADGVKEVRAGGEHGSRSKWYCVDSGSLVLETSYSPLERCSTTDPWDFGAYMSDALKKAREAQKARKNKSTASVKDELLEKLPVLREMLTTTVVDGKRVPTATLTLMLDMGQCKVMLKDRAEGFLTWGSGDTFSEALMGLEARVSSGDADWVEDRFHKPQGRKNQG